MIDQQMQEQLKALSREEKWDEFRALLRTCLAGKMQPGDVSFDTIVDTIVAKAQLEGELLDPLFAHMDDLVDQLHELDNLEAQVDEVIATQEIRDKITGM